MKKNIIIIIAAVSLVIGSAVLAYALGHRAAVYEQTRFNISVNLALCRLLEDGDTNAVASKLRFLVFANSDYYDRHFSNATVTPRFAKKLAEARVVAGEERKHVVPLSSILTNLPFAPNAKVTFHD